MFPVATRGKQGWRPIASGVATSVVVELALWVGRAWFGASAWPGYQPAIYGAPFFTATPRSLGFTLIVLAISAARLSHAGDRFPDVANFWLGCILGVVAILIATPSLRADSNMWPIDLVFLGACTLGPIMVGAGLGVLARVLARGRTTGVRGP